MDRRFRRRRTRPPVFVLLLLALVATRLFMTQRDDPPPEALYEGDYQVERVVDGDTLLLDNGARVRLQGIDTPETVDPDRPVECFGPEADLRTRQLLPPGTSVLLVRDIEARDRYGRLLAYVYRVEDGLFVNRTLVDEGLADVLIIAPNDAHAAELRRAAAEHRLIRPGLPEGGVPAGPGRRTGWADGSRILVLCGIDTRTLSENGASFSQTPYPYDPYTPQPCRKLAPKAPPLKRTSTS